MRHPTPLFPVPLGNRTLSRFTHGKSKLPRWLRCVLLLAGCGAFSLTMAATAPHTFTDPTGKTIAGEILSVKNGEVVVRRTDGKAFSLDVQTLSAEDLGYVNAWRATPAVPQDAVATTDSDL
ncbi:MAG TPA: hypothetical protein VK737_04830, partial [Opitutales bacterium]|nr:hypothetical protein [Opitutales bacterium]